MSQSTLDDDLFDEAADEIRADVEESLEAARAALPGADDVWDTDAENTLGVLNGLRTALDAGDAIEHLRDAKKWYTMGERADAFEGGGDLAAEIESLEDVVGSLDDAADQVGDLAALLPELRGTLQDFDAAGEPGPGEESEADEAEAE